MEGSDTRDDPHPLSDGRRVSAGLPRSLVMNRRREITDMGEPGGESGPVGWGVGE